MDNLARTKKEAFSRLLVMFGHELSRKGCNDFCVENTPELYAAIEESEVRNLRLKSVEEFRNHPEYEDYKPFVKDGKIWTMDYTILEILKSELGLL